MKEVLRKTVWVLATTLLWTLPAYADSDEVVRRFVKNLPAADVEQILVDVPVGEVVIGASDDQQVHFEVSLECDERGGTCEELAQRIKVSYVRDDGDLTLKVKEWPKTRNDGLEAHVHVRMPRTLPLKAHLGVGELRIETLESDVNADLGVGELSITLPAAAVGTVNADTGIGEANLVAGGRRYESAGLMAREIRWSKGTGKARVEADCGVGEISIRLTK